MNKALKEKSKRNFKIKIVHNYPNIICSLQKFVENPNKMHCLQQNISKKMNVYKKCCRKVK